jgi:sulfide:quinone oxidoreductase
MTAPRLVVAGGGVAGIEAALALRAHMGTRAEITLLAADDRFLYRPWSVTEPFGRGGAVAVDLAGLAVERGLTLALESLQAVDTERRAAITDVAEHAYDHLVLALGARQAEAVRGAFTFRGPANGAELGALLDEDSLGAGAAVAFVAPSSAVWPLPAYELALLTARRARDTGSGVTAMVITAEASPLEAFGPETSADVARLLAEQGVNVLTETAPDHFDGSTLSIPMAGTLMVDRVVALPGLLGRPIPGVPHDAGGFVEVDEFCRVEGVDFVYAVGDMTARPLKQGGLATQQADVAADVIAAALGEPVAVEPYSPVLRAMLLTGDGPRYLRHPRVPEFTPETHREAPWWPPHKISGRHLSPYLAAHGDLVFTP